MTSFFDLSDEKIRELHDEHIQCMWNDYDTSHFEINTHVNNHLAILWKTYPDMIELSTPEKTLAAWMQIDTTPTDELSDYVFELLKRTLRTSYYRVKQNDDNTR